MSKSTSINQTINVDETQPLLIFGGPYSNLNASLSLIQICKELQLDAQQVICTGDMVAYCARPEETSQLIKNWGPHIVMGNCEEQLATNADNCACGFQEGSSCAQLSENWYDFAKKRISEDTRDWMGRLPKTIRFQYNDTNFCVLHGNYGKINEFVFPSTPDNQKSNTFADAEADVIIGGHSGLPFIQQFQNKLWYNPGVIGMPANDGTSDGWYGIVKCEDDVLKFSLHRLSYDAEQESSILRNAGFADPYAEALVTGLWPSLDILPEAERKVAGQALPERSLDFRKN